jgi:hypothetical protein
VNWSSLVPAALSAASPVLRFRLLCACSKALALLLPASSRYRNWHAGWRPSESRYLNQTAETALYRVLDRATRYQVEFDPLVEWQNTDELLGAYSEHQGVLLVGVHTLLNKLALRWLHDMDIPFAAYSVAPFRIPGTRIDADTLDPSPASMFKARTLLKSGGVIAAMIDRRENDNRRVIEIRAGNATLRISDSLLQLALKCGSRIVFFASRLDESGRPIVRFGRPSLASSSAAEFAKDLAVFVSDLLASDAGPKPYDSARLRVPQESGEVRVTDS